MLLAAKIQKFLNPSLRLNCGLFCKNHHFFRGFQYFSAILY